MGDGGDGLAGSNRVVAVLYIGQCAFGRTDAGRLLTVVFTMRRSLLRVISVRPMSRRERKGYGKANDA